MTSPLNHIAIIMDGNRRWAQEKGLLKARGHIKGIQSVKSIVKYCVNKKIPYLSLYTFSTENWKRKSSEIRILLTIIKKALEQYESVFMENQIRLHTIGDLTYFPEALQNTFQSICDKTKNNQALNLILAANYGGRKEILDAFKKWYHSGKKVEELEEESFEEHLDSHRFPYPDLMIRTGGVRRISNFYLWSSAYSELYFSDLMWPDFDDKELEKAIEYYEGIKRRFGGA